MTVAAKGSEAKVKIGDTPMAVNSCTLKKTGSILEREGMRGTRTRNKDDTRTGPYSVAGTIELEPSPTELESLMALAIGADGDPDEALTEFDVIVDRKTNTHTYSDCKVNRCVLRGAQGGFCSVTLDLVGKTQSDDGEVGDVASTAPYIFADLTLKLLGDPDPTARETLDFELTIDNGLTADRFTNGLTVTDIPENDRLITLRSTHPYITDNEDLLGQATPTGGTLELDDGTKIATFTFGVLQPPEEDPDVSGKDSEIVLALNMVARQNGETADIGFTLGDSS
jgi:hypothetical protein